jgi:TonB family protein
MGRKPWAIVGAACSVAVVTGAAAASDGEDSRAAAAVSDVARATIECHANYGRSGPLTGDVEIDVSVAADGRATSVTTPAGTPDRLAAAAQCVGVRLKYQPALHEGQPVADRLVLRVEFPTLPEIRGDLRRVVDYCHAPWTLEDLMEGNVNMIARVGTDGKIKEHQLPAGMLPWMTDATKCVVERLEFYPARLRTTLVESWVLVPLEFNLSYNRHFDAEVEPPRPRSDEAAILAAYRKCYPADQTAMVTIQYRITVEKTGLVRKAELVESSGNAALDEAGACILRLVRFAPARRNGINVRSTLNWPLLVRPAG